MPTVSDLIHSSFRLINAVVSGELLEAVELSDALVSLNQMTAIWNSESLSVVGRQRLAISMQFGVNTYPLPIRPIRIEAASAANGGVDWPLKLIDATGYEAIDEKAAQAVAIKKLFCDYQYPQATAYIWPTPRVGGGTLEMWIYAPIMQFASLAQTIDLAPGYEIALRYNFAVALLPEYPHPQVEIQSLLALAQSYKASIVQLNQQNHALSQAQAPQMAALQQAAQ